MMNEVSSSPIVDLLLERPEDADDSVSTTAHSHTGEAVYRLVLDHDDDDDSTQPTRSNNTPPIPIGAVANLCSATLGAGVLALPQAMYEAGILCGMMLLLAAGVSTYYSIEILARATAYYQYYSYESLAEHVLQSKGIRSLVESSMLAFCLGCAIAYMIAVGDILQQAGLLLWNSRSISMICIWTIAMMPLSMLKSMKSIAGASAIGVSAIGTLVFSAAIHALTTAHHHDSAVPFLAKFMMPAHGMMSILTTCPVFLFAFSCQPNVSAIYHEMEAPSESIKQDRMMGVAVSSVSLCGSLYTSIAIIVLADFGSSVLPNMLSNYTDGQMIMKVATAAMALAVVLAYPLNIFPARVTLMGLLEGKYPTDDDTVRPNANLTEALLQDEVEEQSQRNGETNGSLDGEANGSLDGEANGTLNGEANGILNGSRPNGATARAEGGSTPNGVPKFHLQQHIVITLFLTGTSLAMALIIPDIKVMFGILGGTASSVIGFCIPGMLGCQLCKDLKRDTGKTQWESLIVSYMLLVGGTMVGVITTVATIYELVAKRQH